MSDIETLERRRAEAMHKVRQQWDALCLNGLIRPDETPAWPEYLAAFAALDKARDKQTEPQ